MKKDIHPNLNNVCFVDVSTGKKFLSRSTASSKKTENIDGLDHHVLVRDATGKRLAKRDSAHELEGMRKLHNDPANIFSKMPPLPISRSA